MEKKGKEKEEKEKEKERDDKFSPPQRHNGRYLRAGEHRFELVTFYLPTSCSYCGEYIWTLSQGAQCKDCKYNAHSECAPDVPKECAVRLRRTRSATSPLVHGASQKAKSTTQNFNRHNIIKEGQLMKMGLSDGSWSYVWVILKGEALYVFRPQQHEIQYTTPLATLPLAEESFSIAPISSLRPHSFVVYVEEGQFYFSATTEEEMKEWVKTVKTKRKEVMKKPLAKSSTDYEATTHEMTQSFMFMSYISHPEEFAWEDVPIREKEMLKMVHLLELEPRKPLTPELELGNLELVGKDEVQYFRAKVPRVIRAQEVGRVRLINAEIVDTPIPATFPQHFLVLIRYQDRKYRIKCNPDRTLSEVVVNDLLLKLKPMDMSCSWAMPTIEDYVVKVGNVNEYIFDMTVKLSAISYVRDCINRSKSIEFEVVEYAPLSNRTMNRWNIIPDQPLKTGFVTVKADRELGMDTEIVQCHDVQNVAKHFELKIAGVKNFSKEALYATNKFFTSDIEGNQVSLFAVCGIYYAGELIAPAMHTQPAFGQPVWEEWIKSETLRLGDIPREARLCFTFYACLSDSGGTFAKVTKMLRGGFTEFVPLGWVNFNWVDFRGLVKTGRHTLHLWPSTSALQNPLASCVPNSDPSSLALVVEFPTTPKPIVFTDERLMETPLPFETKPPTENELAQLTRIAKKDALCSLSTNEKKLVWMHRYYLKKAMPNALSKVLLSVSWHVRAYIKEVHRMLDDWEKVHVIYALELLDVRFPDAVVRRFAVKCLHALTDRELVEYLPQLVQVLKSEPYHYSPLSEFLLLRAVHSIIVAHPLFWHLMAEIHMPNIAARFKLMIEATLLGTEDDELLKEFKKEITVVNGLGRIALAVKELPTANDRKEGLKSLLQKLRVPESFTLPNNQKFEANGVLIDKCRVMDSFTKPLWLVFGNEGGQTTQVIFKAGDDLRTDILSLQMIRIMDGLWKNEGLDLHMQPYRAVSTGDGLGIIEVISDSQTTAAISQTYGGGGAISAFSTTALRDWLRACNPTEKAHQEAINNFTLSCAGYCVATYILGVGDRHNDNIMCSYSGNMFHIDFGYFLGQRVTFAGIPRETTPFVFTPDFAEAMGGENSDNFRRFVKHCCKAYNIIRKHAHLFITLFVMMLSSGIEQLKDLEDLYYLRDALSLDLTDEEAARKFTELIYLSLHNQMTQLNNAVHIHFHPKKG